MNLAILSPVMDKWQGRLDSLALVWQLNSESKPVKLRLKIDLESDPACTVV